MDHFVTNFWRTFYKRRIINAVLYEKGQKMKYACQVFKIWVKEESLSKKNALTFCKNFKGVLAQRSGGRENLRKKLWGMPKKINKKGVYSQN